MPYCAVTRVIFASACCVFICADIAANEKPKRIPGFTIGKDTTRILGPLDKDGRIDYETALNQKLSEGVTPKNNANVLLFKAWGPHPNKAIIPAEFWKALQIDAPPERGDYFVGSEVFASQRFKQDGKAQERFDKQMDAASKRTWTAKEFPDVAAWLKVNEKPLAVVFEATKRTHYYYPLLCQRDQDGKSKGLISAQTVGVQMARDAARALATHAMLRVSEKKYDDAWQDLLACHRLARLVGRGTVIEALVGNSANQIACDADLGFIEAAKGDSNDFKRWNRDFRILPAMPNIAASLDLAARYEVLEWVMMLDRGQQAIVLSEDEKKALEEAAGKLKAPGINWDPALRGINQLYDQVVSVHRIEKPGPRRAAIAKLDAEWRERDRKPRQPKDTAREILAAETIGHGIGKAIGDVLIQLGSPATLKFLENCDRTAQNEINISLAFALAAYKADEGRYPKSLDALAPKYLKTVPDDLFSGKSLIYRLDGNGYLLYSVGVKGKDDGGRTADDDPRGDDLAVRMRN